MTAPALDSFALLAFLRDESGGGTVARILEEAGQSDQPAHMTEVNYAEVQYMVRRKSGDAAWERIARGLTGISLEFHPVDRKLADLAAKFKFQYKMSLANAFSAALAKELRCELVTGDLEFKPLEKEVKIIWLG